MEYNIEKKAYENFYKRWNSIIWWSNR
jgi:hypothetical protein